MSLTFTDYHKMSISELVGLIARLNGIIEDKRREQRTELLRELRQMAEANGYQLSDLVGGLRRKSDGEVTPTNGTIVMAKPATDRPLIRDPATGKTWSGRGRRPSWYKPEMANGRSGQGQT